MSQGNGLPHFTGGEDYSDSQGTGERLVRLETLTGIAQCDIRELKQDVKSLQLDVERLPTKADYWKIILIAIGLIGLFVAVLTYLQEF